MFMCLGYVCECVCMCKSVCGGVCISGCLALWNEECVDTGCLNTC